MALTANFDKPSYAPGEQIVLTVVDDSRTTTETVTVTDAAASSVTASASILAGAAPSVASSTGRVYTVSTDDGVTTVFVTTA